jgi:hypothetical protein
MKVVHGPRWLKEIEWYYGKPPRYDQPPVTYYSREDVTKASLKLTLRSPLPTRVGNTPFYLLANPQSLRVLPEHIAQGLLGLLSRDNTVWIEDHQTLLIDLYPHGQLQHFDRFLQSVVRKLRGPSTPTAASPSPSEGETKGT